MTSKRAHHIFKQRVTPWLLSVFICSCSITAVRPAQEMSNMEVAIKAAKEVGADLLAPELFRTSLERSQEARKQYRFKNFMQAKELADQARVFAEKAEFESIRNGGKREAVPQDPLAEPSYPPESIAPPASDNGNMKAPATK
jgi:hypothetical protein